VTPGEALNAAADLIERNGLAVGAFVRRVSGLQLKECSMCTLGALGFVVAGTPAAVLRLLDSEAETLLATCEQAICEHINAENGVADWSDSTPQDEVVATLRYVADELVA
jgi:hypothetical protein